MKKLILIYIIIPNFLFGQDTLTLFDAINIGLQENFSVQISKKNKKISEINNNWANAGALPEPFKTIIKLKVPELLKGVERVDPKNMQLGTDSPIPALQPSSRYATNVGKQTPALMKQIFQNFFKGTKVGLSSRVQKLVDIGKLIQSGAQPTATQKKRGIGESIEEKLTYALVIDYLRRITQSYEASASGFLFENFFHFFVYISFVVS